MDNLEFIASASIPNNDKSFGESRSNSSSSFFELLYDLIYLGGISKKLMINEDLIKETIETYRAVLSLLEYLESREQRPLFIPITLFLPKQDGVSPEDAKIAWDHWAGISPRIIENEGGHFYFAKDKKHIANLLSPFLIKK